MAAFQIANKTVGKDAPVFIIAEAGINHDGKLDQAFALIDAAAEAGADAVKFQMFQADRMYQKDPGLYKTAAGKDVSIFSLVQSMEMPAEWILPLLDYCREKQVIFLSTVCDEGSADLLQSTSPSAFKIASYEINHLPVHFGGRVLRYGCNIGCCPKSWFIRAGGCGTCGIYDL